MTGLLIRNFFKEYRELRFTSSGSFELSEIEHNAYLQRLTIQIDNIDSQRYLNRKTMPDHSHYGYLTMFKGSSVIERVPVEFPRQRVFERINQGIWNYHQSNEGLSLPMIGLGNQVARYAKRVADFLENPGPAWVWEVPDYTIVDSISDLPVLELIFPDYEGIEGTEGDQDSAKYRAFPIASPFPDIFKFKGDIPLSFRFRLESWYLVNPAVYILDNPTDTRDETEGEDEYPSPEIGDGDGDGSEFPDPDPLPSGRDPRDGNGGQFEPGAEYSFRVFLAGNHLDSGGDISPYDLSFEKTFFASGLPLVADASDSPYGVVNGVALYLGIVVKDRFGTVIETAAPTVAFPKGGHSVSTQLIQ